MMKALNLAISIAALVIACMALSLSVAMILVAAGDRDIDLGAIRARVAGALSSGAAGSDAPAEVEGDGTAVWWEGEQTAETNFPRKSWLTMLTTEQMGKLSQRGWLTNEGRRKQGSPAPYARYTVNVPEDGTYNLWVRKFWHHGPFRWRFDDQPWQVCDKTLKPVDIVNVRKSVVVNWIRLGAVELTGGKHRFELELLVEEKGKLNCGIDSFLLISGQFKPAGAQKPPGTETAAANVTTDNTVDARAPAAVQNNAAGQAVETIQTIDLPAQTETDLLHADATDDIWWEAEEAQESNFPPGRWLKPKPDEVPKLSAGAWLSSEGNRKSGAAPLRATYRVEVDGGVYHLWVRKFWHHGPFRWRFDDQPWRHCTKDLAAVDIVNLRKNIVVNWKHLGLVQLDSGDHHFEIELTVSEGERQVGAIDCFLLTGREFKPRGTARPDEQIGQPDPGYFIYNVAGDPFSDEALLDLRSLNEAQAGQNGFVQRRGDSLTLADGRPVRFWGVNVNSNNAGRSRQSIDTLTRKLAKLGVNLLRYHDRLVDRDDPTRLDARRLDNLMYLVESAKQQGIYSALSWYFPLAFRMDELTGVASESEKRSITAVYIDPHARQRYHQWLRQMMLTPSPYSGRPLAQESAVAMIELVNEDNLFWFSFSPDILPRRLWALAEQRYADWLVDRYGSLDAVTSRWAGVSHPDDEPAAGRMGLYGPPDLMEHAWHDASAKKRVRIADQTLFMMHLQRELFESTRQLLRNEIGYDGLIIAGNWKTMDRMRLAPLDQYSYTAGDVIDAHEYFHPDHEGEGSKFSVKVGHTYADRSALRTDEADPYDVVQIEGYPQIISEYNWSNPNRYRAEAPAMAAIYGGALGLDGICFFAVDSNDLSDTVLNKFAVASPVMTASFPAMALAYRRGDIAPIEPVLVIQDSDPARANWSGPATIWPETVKEALPVLHRLGPVVRRYADRPAVIQPAPLDRYRNATGSGYLSSDGQLRFDPQTGLLAIDAPRVQGIVGMLGEAGSMALTDVTIQSDNPIGSICVVALDGRPIRQSRELLIQAVSEERLCGFAADNGKITKTGYPPYTMAELQGTVELHRRPDRGQHLTLLDPNGYVIERRRLEPDENAAAIRIELVKDVAHYILTTR
jgi:hypothetical protein